MKEGYAIEVEKPMSYNEEVEASYLKALKMIKATSLHLQDVVSDMIIHTNKRENLQELKLKV